MKKKELIIVIILAVVAIVGVGVVSNWSKITGKSSSTASATPSSTEVTTDSTASADTEEEGTVLVAIQHGSKIIKEFDPSVDAIYSFEGDYGHMEVHVQDGKWCVTNEECPNHICSSMGWAGVDDLIPITCMPNNVMVYVEEQ